MSFHAVPEEDRGRHEGLVLGREGKLRAHLLCYYPGSGKGFASSFTAQQASHPPHHGLTRAAEL